MNLIRIGDKVISRAKLYEAVDEILELRGQGLSQSEVGERLNIERTFISRLEGLGEIRKGHSIGVVGFPIKNKEEIKAVLETYGVDYYLLMSEKERNDYVTKSPGGNLANGLFELINKFRSFDTVVALASDYRNRIIKDMLDNQVIEIDIGKSPLTEDVSVDIEALKDILKILKG